MIPPRMSITTKPNETPAPVFAWMFPHLVPIARHYGYALALHGSMARDLDLIAVPWGDDASSAEVLVEAIRVAVDGVQTIACWKLTKPEIEEVVRTGKVYLIQLNFGARLQPQCVAAFSPFQPRPAEGG